MKVHAFVFEKPGAPSVMKWRTFELGDPGPNEALIRHTAIGLNYIDTYHRSGLYPLPSPSGLGLEAAGVVEAVGKNVTHIRKGDRVAYGSGPLGAYAEARIMPADVLIKLPKGIEDDQAAAMMLKGMTVEYLFNRTNKVKAEDWVLFQAAAGGVGLIAGQWLESIGAHAIGTAGGPKKVKLAKEHGYEHVIDYKKTQNIADRVKKLTKGEGVPVVYDSVGKDTWVQSLNSLQPRGLMVSFGSSSGPVEDFGLGELASRGSLYVTRPSLMAYTSTRQELESSARALFKMVTSGKIKIEINQTYPLKEAPQAHRDLEGRKTTGSTIFIP
ncbi:MAG: quinone oxidoreductase family protein [Alphaproteobacteria bacterium]|jgi:NADPH2:quinone reductase